MSYSFPIGDLYKCRMAAKRLEIKVGDQFHLWLRFTIVMIVNEDEI